MVDAERALTVLRFPELVYALDRAHRDPAAARDDLLMQHAAPGTGRTDCFFLRAAWQHGSAMGAKLISVLPGNAAAAPSLPTVQSVYVLFDGASGSPVACIDGGVLTAFKTAADSALASRYLSREDSQHLLMVGAGSMAPHLVRAHLAVRPGLRRVSVWNRTASRAAQLVARLNEEGIDAETVDSLETAVGEADVISCATMSRSPLLRGDWLHPGTHIDLVGSFTPEMREADDVAIRRSRVYVDCYGTTLEDVGEIAIPLRNGTLSREDIVADFYELCREQRPGREAPEDITLFKNGGGGHLDLMTAQFIVDRLGAVGTA